MKTGPVKRALIIAAGRGERLNAYSKDVPKCLIPVNGTPIITRILSSLSEVGIDECVLVTGYKGNIIEQTLGERTSGGLALRYVRNEEWKKKNGVSVLAARDEFLHGGSFLLMMSDHLFSPQMLENVVKYPLEEETVGLATDERIDSVFDIDDATKVQKVGEEIHEIGKNISGYNAIDCGLFKCTDALFDALQNEFSKTGDCSLTDACLQLARKRRLYSINIGESVWIDVDTPEALKKAESVFSGRGV